MSLLFTLGDALDNGLRIGALSLLAGTIAMIVALGFRWYVDEELPQGIAILLGAAAIAIVLNTTASLGQSIAGTTDLLDARVAVFTLFALFAGAVVSEVGRTIGDRIGDRFGPRGGFDGLETEVATYVRARGKAMRITLPEEIHDIDGFEPVRGDVKEALVGETMVFPGRLSLEELHEAFVTRIQNEHNIGKIDAEFDEVGDVTYLALGRGEAGIGHTLPPGQVAIAIRADPAFSAGPGDHVRVWQTQPSLERLLTAEVRGVAGEIVTLTVDEEDVELLATESGYRLVTLPTTDQPERAFAMILRRANESVTRVTVSDGSELGGRSVADLEVEVLVIKTAEGSVKAPPEPDRVIVVGDVLSAIGRPDVLRRFEDAAQGTSE